MARSKYNKKFEDQISYFINKTNKNIQEVKMLAVYQLFSNVVDRTPVWEEASDHRGTTKWNWTIRIGSPSSRVLTGTDPSGEQTKARGYAQLKSISDPYADIYIANSVPYIFKLEDGGYPSPSKSGKTSGGFSMQAPQGMAKISAMEWNTYIPNAVRMVKK